MTEPMKRLRRSTTDRKVAGVLGGLGEYFAVDPTAVRVLFLLLVLVTGGAALIAYPLMWLVMPEAEPAKAGPPPTVASA
jgi:phage shock protein C